MQVLMRLNTVCSIESEYTLVVAASRPNDSTIDWTKCTKGLKIARAQMTPKRLNTVWASAALLALTLPTAAAILAVMVVPMFSPNTIAAAISN